MYEVQHKFIKIEFPKEKLEDSELMADTSCPRLRILKFGSISIKLLFSQKEQMATFVIIQVQDVCSLLSTAYTTHFHLKSHKLHH